MKINRNAPCPCGSGKKYKHCCIDSSGKIHAQFADEIGQLTALNPDLSIDDLEAIMAHKTAAHNDSSLDDFCGLSPSQMQELLHAPFAHSALVTIKTPTDLSKSPVMRYLALILETIDTQGPIKLTPKGNLPVKVVNQASQLLPEFAIAKYNTIPSISDFTGSNEDKFNALHFSRIIADIAGVVTCDNKYLSASKSVIQQYQKHGITTFFQPLLATAVNEYNWGYLDHHDSEAPFSTVWLFMLWRLKTHASIARLCQEVRTAFPFLLEYFSATPYSSAEHELDWVLETRFISRFLEYWGFLTVNPKKFDGDKEIAREATLLPLFKETFTFSI